MDYTPTNFTTVQGGDWIPVVGADLTAIPFAAVMFSDGSVWDAVAQSWSNKLARDPFVPAKAQPAASKPVLGRPTAYDPIYCDIVIAYCSQGLSLTAFAGNIGVARSTLNNWMAANPDFLEACKIAMGKRAEFLEAGMIAADATGPMVTARRFALVNANVANEPTDWAERSETTTTINKGDGWADIFAAIGNQTKTIVPATDPAPVVAPVVTTP